MLYGKRRKDMKMLELLVVATTLVFLACGIEFATVDASSDGKSIPPIYWNTSASIFKNPQDHVQYVKIGQKMDIICPMRSHNGGGDGALYFILYKVTKENFDNCNTHGQKRLLTCDAPQSEKKYTFLFEDITPSPWGLTFSPKETYYFISTSDGTQAGISNQKGGACTDKHMKLKISVQPRDHKDHQRPPHIPPLQNVPSTSPPKSTSRTVRPIYTNRVHQNDNVRDPQQGKDGEHSELVNSNGLVIGVVLGACAVLFIVLLGFLGYKVYRKRRTVKKYQSPGISASRTGTPQAQVTLLPISSHPGTHMRTHTVRSGTHPLHLEIQDMSAPPPYNESILDHAGSTMEV